MLDADFMDLVSGKLKGQDAFMKGKMKIKGNMAKAMKFNPSILPKDAKLWMDKSWYLKLLKTVEHSPS